MKSPLRIPSQPFFPPLFEATFQEAFRQAVDREARADLVEKRKQTEAELEVPGTTLCWGNMGDIYLCNYIYRMCI